MNARAWKRSTMVSFVAIVYALILVLNSTTVEAQSAGFLGQARYYTALEHYRARRFGDAITAANEAKGILEGSNVLVQYVHIMAAYHSERYTEASREIERFFALIERQELPVNFPRGAQELTNDETEDILRILDRVSSAVANRVEERREADAQRRAEENQRRISELTSLIEARRAELDPLRRNVRRAQMDVSNFLSGTTGVYYVRARSARLDVNTGARQPEWISLRSGANAETPWDFWIEGNTVFRSGGDQRVNRTTFDLLDRSDWSVHQSGNDSASTVSIRFADGSGLGIGFSVHLNRTFQRAANSYRGLLVEYKNSIDAYRPKHDEIRAMERELEERRRR